jgi:zinc/manganese transport system permease protein
METFEVIRMPTLVTCLLLPGLLVYLGLHIVRREVIFAGIALLRGNEPNDWQTYAWSLVLTLAGAAVFALTRTKARGVPQEALIGIVYVVAAAAAILVLNKTPHGAEELRNTLVGDVLTEQAGDLWRTIPVFAAVAVTHVIFRKPFQMLSFEPDRAAAQGVSAGWWDFLFYALFGLVVTSFVRVAGVLMIFSYLIVPAVCASFLVQSVGARLLVGWAIAAGASLVGLYGACLPGIDAPPGPMIVCALGVALIVAAVASAFRNRASAAK